MYLKNKIKSLENNKKIKKIKQDDFYKILNKFKLI